MTVLRCSAEVSWRSKRSLAIPKGSLWDPREYDVLHIHLQSYSDVT